MTVTVKYCGGCNPRYDRTKAVEELKSALPHVTFVPASKGEKTKYAIAVCGCSAQCVDVSDLRAETIVYLSKEEEVNGLIHSDCMKLQKRKLQVQVGDLHSRNVVDQIVGQEGSHWLPS